MNLKSFWNKIRRRDSRDSESEVIKAWRIRCPFLSHSQPLDLELFCWEEHPPMFRRTLRPLRHLHHYRMFLRSYGSTQKRIVQP